MAQAMPRRVFELLTARLCHELVGPVGAANNGLELLADSVDTAEGPVDPADLAFAGEAIDLAAESGRRAEALLKFYRIALGTVGTDGPSDGAGGNAETLLRDGLWAMRIDWTPPAGDLLAPIETAGNDRGAAAKLLLNLHVTVALGLMRGGRISVSDDAPLTVTAEGEGARLPEEVAVALDPDLASDRLTVRSVQAWFCGWLAREAGFAIRVPASPPGQVRLVLEPSGAA